MTTLEQRITETLAAHDEFTYDAEHRETACTGCGWAITNALNPDHADKFPERKRDHQSQMITAAVAPVIAEAQAEAWDKGWDAGNDHGYDASQVERGYIPIEREENTNPYRSNDE